MVDYDEYTHLNYPEDSSPEALFFGSSKPYTRFTTAVGNTPVGFTFGSLGGAGSPEFETEGDSPGIGRDMSGLRLNSRFPSPVQGTVRLEDVMLPQEDDVAMDNPMDTNLSNDMSLFPTKTEGEQVENGYQRYIPTATVSPSASILVGLRLKVVANYDSARGTLLFLCYYASFGALLCLG